MYILNTSRFLSRVSFDTRALKVSRNYSLCTLFTKGARPIQSKVSYPSNNLTYYDIVIA